MLNDELWIAVHLKMTERSETILRHSMVRPRLRGF